MQQRRIHAFRKQKAALGVENNGEIANSLPIAGSTPQLRHRQVVQLAQESTHSLTNTIPSSTDPSDGISIQEDLQALNHNVQPNDPNSSDDEPLDEDYGILPIIGYTSESSGDEEGEVKDSRGRIRIRPTGRDSFEGADGILRNAYSILHCYYKGPWRKWSMVPEDHKNIWWEEFKKRYFWKDKHIVKVYKNWRAKCSEHLRSTLADARKTGKRPDFIEPEHWVDMLNGWEQDKTFKRQSEMNKRNRASDAPNGIGLFAGGSKPIVKIRAEYERKHGKKMSQEKLMEKAYKKRNGEWSSERAPIALERYKLLCEKFKKSHPEEITEEQANNLWLDAVGGKKKCNAFCLASFGSSTSNLRNPGSSSSPRTISVDKSQMEELRRTMEEELRKKVVEDVQRTMEARTQELLKKQREEDAVIYQRMLEMQRTRYVPPTPQVNTSFPPMLNSTTHSYAPSFGHQQRFVDQLPVSTHLFDSPAFAAIRSTQDGPTQDGSTQDGYSFEDYYRA